MMKSGLSIQVYILIYIVGCWTKSTLIIPGRKTEVAAALIVIPGASIKAIQYAPLASKIQDSSPYSLWVYLQDDWIANLVNPLQMGSALKSAIKSLREAGLPTNASIYVAAHSLGGVFLDMYIREDNSIKADGILLYGSYINKDVLLKNYPIPVLTLSGDQDGMCRVTRIAKEYQQLYYNSTPYDRLQTPVIVLQGMNHTEFASGKMPAMVKRNDLVADKTFAEVYMEVANVSNAFMALHGAIKNETILKNSRATLLTYYDSTNELVTPYIAAMELDHKSPRTNSSEAQLVQQTISGLLSSGTDKDLISHVDIRVTEYSAASFLVAQAKASLTNNTAILNIPFYMDRPINPMDISLAKQSPNELQAKMFSQQKLKEAFPEAKIGPSTECGKFNEATYLLATVLTPFSVSQRFTTSGQKLTFAPDRHTSSILEWESEHIQWTKINTTTMRITSPVWKSGNYQYCKTLTLSNVMEWIYIDSLKK